MNSKSSALIVAFNQAKFWQWIGCICLSVMLCETIYICWLHLALWACRAG